MRGLTSVHPEVVLREDVLPALSLPKTEVVDALRISRETLYRILRGQAPVALKLGKAFGNSPEFLA